MKKIVCILITFVLLIQCLPSSILNIIALSDDTDIQENEFNVETDSENNEELMSLIPHFERNVISDEENIDISFDNNAELSYLGIEYEGITVSIVNSEKFQFIISAESNEESSDKFGKLVVSARTNDDEIIYGTLYTYQSNGYLYLSELSYDCAWYLSQEELLNGRDSDALKKCEDAYSALFGSDMNHSIAISQSDISNKIKVNGNIKWEYNEEHNTLPLKIAKIEIRKKNLIGSSYIADGYTDKDGNFSIEVNASDMENKKIFIRVLLEAQTFMIRLDWLITHYYYDSNQIQDISGGDIITLDCTIPYKDSSVYKATYIHQAMTISERFAKSLGFNPSKTLRVAYPTLSFEYYDEKANQTYSLNKMAFCYDNVAAIGTDSYNNTNTIAHEYSHFIQNSMGNYGATLLEIAAYNPNHNGRDDYYDTKGNKKFAMHLAWSEGWGYAFSVLAQNYYKNEYDKLANPNYKMPLSEDGCIGEFQEKTIRRFLWSLVDINSTKTKLDYQLPWTLQEWWNMTTVKGTCRLPDFINTIESESNDFGVNIDYATLKKSIAKKLTLYNISPEIISLLYLSTERGSSPTIKMIMNGSEKYPNNKFIIEIRTLSGTLLATTSEFSISKGNTTEFYIKIPQSTWNQAANHFSCYSTNYVNISVKGYRSDSDADAICKISGPYTSSYYTAKLTVAHTYSEKYKSVDSSYHELICSDCGTSSGEQSEHQFTHTYLDNQYHTDTCSDCGYSRTSLHTLKESDLVGNYANCQGCGAAIKIGGNTILPVSPFKNFETSEIQ